jgi:hypothetical protein
MSRSAIGGTDMRLNFKRNLGNTDRVIRLVLSLALLLLPLILPMSGGWAFLLYAIGVFSLLQAYVGY